MYSIADALRNAAKQGVQRLDAQRLLLHVVGKTHGSAAWLVAHDTDALSMAQKAAFAHACQRRVAGEPVAYITGWRGFYGLDLQITPAVLDPRPDTETLVDWTLEVVQDVPTPRVLDLGTGSGAIALAVKSQRADAQVVAVDASATALAVAGMNARRLGLEITMIQSDWFAALDVQQRFDCVVSNPPYLAAHDPHLPDLQHEPQQALVAEGNGLGAYEVIVQRAPGYLHNGGWLLFEHGWQQHTAVHDLLANAGYDTLGCRQDLAGHTRCTGGRCARNIR